MSINEPQEFDTEQLTRQTYQVVPFAERTGIRVVEAERGRVRLMMPLEPNVNHVGTMYAGALFTLAEIPGGTLWVTTFDIRRFYPIVKDLQITFLKPAVTDIYTEVSMTESEAERLSSEAEADGKVDYSWESELVDTNGVVVARTQNVYQLRSMDMPLKPDDQ